MQGFQQYGTVANLDESEKCRAMPSLSDIVKDSVVEFSRLQDWMISSKEHGDMDTYNMMHKRYVELKVILSAASVNVTEIDRIQG